MVPDVLGTPGSPPATFTSESNLFPSATMYNIESVGGDIHYNVNAPPEAPPEDIAKYISLHAFDNEILESTGEDIHPRGSLVSEIQRRLGSKKSEILFLLGPAGMGKTTAMRLLASQLKQTPDQALAVFFSDDARKGPAPTGAEAALPAKETLTLTLLHQLRTHFTPSLPFPTTHLPNALSSFSIERQITDWIIEPVLAADGVQEEHFVILIDSLDTITKSPAEQRDIVNGMRKLVSKLQPLVSVVISTRLGTSTLLPPDVRHLPKEAELQCPITPISLAETTDADSDIADFYKSELPALKLKGMRDVLSFVVGFTAGNFALAAGFVDHFRHGEGRNKPFPGSNDSARQKAFGFLGLDALYDSAFSSIPEASVTEVRAIIARILFASEPQTPADIRSSLGPQFTYGHIKALLSPLQGIVEVPDQSRSGRHHIGRSQEGYSGPDTPRVSSFGFSSSSVANDTGESDSEATPSGREWTVRVINPGKQAEASFRDKIRQALPVEMESWMVEFIISGVALAMNLCPWKPGVSTNTTPEGRTIQRRTELGDVGYMKETGDFEVLFNIFTGEGFWTPPGFKPLERLNPTCEQSLNKWAYTQRYGGGKIVGKIKLATKWVAGSLPEALICSSRGETFGGATVHQSGHQQETLHINDRQAVVEYLRVHAGSWYTEELQQRLPSGAGLFCVLSALYTDLWASVAFSGQQIASELVSRVETDPDQKEFRSWARVGGSDFQVHQSSYPATRLKQLPEPRVEMTACVGMNVVLLKYSQKRAKKLGFGSVSSSGHSLTSGRSSGHAPSALSKGTRNTESTFKRKTHSISMSSLVPSWLTRRETR